MDTTIKDGIWSAIRSTLIALGGWLTAKGWIDNETLNALVGALMIALPALVGVLQKVSAERKARQLLAVAVQTGVTAVKVGAVDPSIPITPKFAAALIEKLAPVIPPVQPLPDPLAGNR
jgi:hypothetical protein